MAHIFSLLILLSANFAWAQISVTSVSRASNYVLTDSDGNSTIIYGGIVGSEADCNTTASTSLCNNCVNDALACNATRIHSALILQVGFTVTGDISGQVTVGFDDGGNYTSCSTTDCPRTSGTLSNGSTGSIEVDWTDLCFEAASDGTCSTGGDTELVIGLASSTGSEPDSSNRIDIPVQIVIPDGDYDLVECADASPSSGVCFLLAFPGDEKVFIDDLQAVGSYPVSNTVNIEALRVYYSETSFTAANYTSSSYVDFELDNDGTPTSDLLEGLTNETLYYFRPAVVDEANNVGFLVDPLDIAATDADCIDGGATATEDAGCDMIATPSRVLGLLTEDVNCFIASAAYGSNMTKEIESLRRFRGKYLMQRDWGRKFVRFYYNYGPKAARWLQQNSFMKPVARTFIYPLAGLAALSNQYGLWVFFAGLFGIGFFGLFIFFGGRKLWHHRKSIA